MRSVKGRSRAGPGGPIEQLNARTVRLKIKEGSNVFVVVGGDHDQAVAAGAQMLLTTARQ